MSSALICCAVLTAKSPRPSAGRSLLLLQDEASKAVVSLAVALRGNGTVLARPEDHLPGPSLQPPLPPKRKGAAALLFPRLASPGPGLGLIGLGLGGEKRRRNHQDLRPGSLRQL